MRSASWGVVMEPSTSERSYGPLTTAREASGKLAISTASATASSSSSQSSRLNWQPSQEENFQTASLGLRKAMLDLRLAKNCRDAMEREDGSILADEGRAVLAMAAKPNPAFHIAFRRQVGALGCHAALQQFHDGKAHHDLGPANHRQRVGRIEGSARNHCRYHTDVSPPGTCRSIDRDLNFQIELAAPVLQFMAVEHVLGSASAIQQNDLAILLPFRHQPVKRRTQRGQPDSSCSNHNVSSGCFLDRPVGPERATNSHGVATFELPHGFGYATDHPSGVLQ